MYKYFVAYDAVDQYANFKGNCCVDIEHKIGSEDIKKIEKELAQKLSVIKIIINNFILIDN